MKKLDFQEPNHILNVLFIIAGCGPDYLTTPVYLMSYLSLQMETNLSQVFPDHGITDTQLAALDVSS